MTKVILPALSVLGLAASALLAVPPAEAKIVCRDGYQVVGRQEIATPYCEAAYMAEVARSYGSKVSAQELRSSPLKWAELCQFIGHDIRVMDYCPGGRSLRLYP